MRTLDHGRIDRETVTLVLDKGSAGLANTSELERRGLGWISALPWNQAPPDLRELPESELERLGAGHPGMRAAAKRTLIHGAEYQCVVMHSATYALEQVHRAVRSLTRPTRVPKRIALELAWPQRQYTAKALRRRFNGWVDRNFVWEWLTYEL